ncbi:MAG: hypothetical protein AAGM22_09670 [Acidobacteriota bacterium]
MRQSLGLFLCLAALLATTSPALAQIPAGQCAIPPGLGATLLFPYFEVDLNDVNGVNTVLSINNGLANAALTRVVVWTDWGIPTLAFDVWLDGFDVQTLSVRSLFDGTIPSTGAGEDLSPFGFCDQFPPDHANPVLTASQVSQLRADHQGQLGPNFITCVGANFGDGIARGYITVDVTSECAGVEGAEPFWTPVSSGAYFDDGDGFAFAINDNRLWGDYTYLDFTGSAAQGSQAVPLWADETLFTGPSEYTFYGRFHNYDARDHRVPLPLRWNQRFLNGGAFGGGADVIVWRDPETPSLSAPCGVTPSPFPLTDSSAFVDEDSDVFLPASNTQFPIATQRTSISSLGAPFDFGFLQVDTTSQADPRALSQAWVETTLSAGSFGFSASWPGTPTAFTCGLDPAIE